MAKHETISAWFWITNSWLSTGGLLFFLRKPMALWHGSPSSGSGAAVTESLWLGYGASFPPAARLNWRMLALLLRAGRSAAVRKHSVLLLMCLKTVMKIHRTEPNTTAQHPLFSSCPGKVRWWALPLQNLIHEPPSAVDVEGEPRTVVPSRTPRKNRVFKFSSPTGEILTLYTVWVMHSCGDTCHFGTT